VQRDSEIEATAIDFARIGKWNYLAHTIREIERRLCADRRITYHIIISDSPTAKHMSTMFYYTAGCDIVLLDDDSKVNNKDLRILLAHELGHIAYNMGNIETLTGWSYSSSDEEELYAWKFAYFLLRRRNNDHKDGVGKYYIYPDGRLEQSIVQIVKNGRPNLYEPIREFVNRVKTLKG